MAYTEKEARALVIEAGHKLLANGLTARTWGNISARLSGNEFLITPSGRAYDTLQPEDLVRVKISDLSYEGERKPSSEKGIHASAYQLRPGVDFIIHTHQFYASAVCAEGKDLPFAPCAAYGLPGTSGLRANVVKAISAHPEASSFLLEKHGALCLGTSLEDAFRLADQLEKNCEARFAARAGRLGEDEMSAAYCRTQRSLRAYIDDYAQIVGPCARVVGGELKTPASDDEEAVRMIVNKNCAAALYVRSAKPLSMADALLQRVVYLTKYSRQRDK